MTLADTFLASMFGEPKSGMSMGVGGGLRDTFAVALGLDARGSIGTLGVGRCAIERWWTGLKQGSW
jgi:hypothetical protein